MEFHRHTLSSKRVERFRLSVVSQSEVMSTRQFGSHTGRRYRIHPGKLNNVRILQDNFEVSALCFAPTDAGFLPEADIMLAQKIALETNEKAALKVAHQSSPLSLLPSVVTLTLASHGRLF
jgi:hypothetical protein